MLINFTSRVERVVIDSNEGTRRMLIELKKTYEKNANGFQRLCQETANRF